MDDGLSEIDLHAYLDGQLDAARAAEVEAYLARDPEATARLRAYHAQTQKLRELARGIALPPLGEASRQLSSRLARQLGRSRSASPLKAAAIALLGIAIGWSGHMLVAEGAGEDVPSFVDEAAEAHSALASEAFASAGDDLDAMPHLLAAIGEPPRLADLKGTDLVLVGAHFVPTDDGPAVLLLCEDGAKQRLSLVMAREPGAADIALRLIHRDGLVLAYWQQNQTAFALTGKLYDEEVLRLANLIRIRQSAS